MSQRIFHFISRADRLGIHPRVAMWAAHLAIFVISGILAFLLRFEWELPPYMVRQLDYALPLWVLAKTASFRVFELDRGWWRYGSFPDVIRNGIGNLVGSLIGTLFILLIAPANFPRSIYLLDLLVCLHATLGVRLFARVLGEAAFERHRNPHATPVVIYGAGRAGAMLLRELRSNARLNYAVRGFIDDNPRKRGMKVQGIRVLGDGTELRTITTEHEIEEILIAIPSANGTQMARILRHCHATDVRCRTIPGLAEIVRGYTLASQIRDVAVKDLLTRSPIRLGIEDIRNHIEGRVVLVTGGAGSIGSELCRQIAAFDPGALVALDAGETPLFHLAEEMREGFPEVRFHAEIGNIQNRRRLEDVFAKYRPSIVYHAAAYKHVPLMEAHVFEAVENNVLGTFTLAAVAEQFEVETFVMISSDKAVHPTNVMGVTKRIAELLIRSLQERGTKYVSVRFGNVLGSQGSVVPLFKRQIAAGGPVTVTHPEMRRYFMTIPEAVQLVLQASTMGKGGEIFVLDMGQPIKIVDLAKNLIRLSGLRPGVDVKIEFTGIRPGEKLYEELNTAAEGVLPTYHEKIKIFAGNGIPEGMITRVNTLRDLCERREIGRLMRELQEIVPEYRPSAYMLPAAPEGAASNAA